MDRKPPSEPKHDSIDNVDRTPTRAKGSGKKARAAGNPWSPEGLNPKLVQPCFECASPMSKRAFACPRCGAPNMEKFAGLMTSFDVLGQNLFYLLSAARPFVDRDPAAKGPLDRGE